MKSIFRDRNTLNKVQISALSTLIFQLQYLHSFSPCPFLYWPHHKPLQHLVSSSNSAAKGLAGAHVSPPYQLWAGRAVQSRCIVLPVPPQQAGLQTPPTPAPQHLTHFNLHILYTSPDYSDARDLYCFNLHPRCQCSLTAPPGLGETCPVEERTSLRRLNCICGRDACL